jgi:hypothetical protein
MRPETVLCYRAAATTTEQILISELCFVDEFNEISRQGAAEIVGKETKPIHIYSSSYFEV